VQANPIKVVPLTDTVARRVIAAQPMASFAAELGQGQPFGSIIGRGDVLDVSVWEAPPAVLFGVTGIDSRLTQSASVARPSGLPEQMVNERGQIQIPFVGSIRAEGRTADQVAREVVSRLRGQAHQPQAIVRVVRNAAANVTIVGEVSNSTRVPLSAKGERLLDILASAGGVRQPVGKTTIQISRAGKVVSMPLDAVIRDPSQNVRMQPDDVITALFQPYSFTALGAIGSNAEVNFEGTGITLAQALGRIGGLREDRADVRGVFVFRLEEPAALPEQVAAGARTTPDGKIPVIYRLDLSDAGSFFVAQGFPIRNKDVVYVSNAPGADIQKFVNIVSSLTFSLIGVGNAIN